MFNMMKLKTLKDVIQAISNAGKRHGSNLVR
ncbi:hypothetical protein SAMN05421770_1011115 [Granulicella rosea]|uniref:Uncharacterized protein n=1 Tax=Granulicella rosea TaxID=474952 RepID=A0A239ETB5_9BACT|nr:hypothetical protein SAMN05421770_1011115 [Granulicella rosea]